MNSVPKRLFLRVRLFSNLAILFAVVVSLFFRTVIDESNLSWQVLLSVLALMVGIPHGAVDHLITIPRTSRWRFIAFVLIYILIAAIAVLAILKWNVIGFQVIVWMSALHFGIGDASFISEYDQLSNRKPSPLIRKFFYAIPAGLLPVIIPLVQNNSSSALNRVNPELINWAGVYAEDLKKAVSGLAILAIIALALNREFRNVTDLVLLGALAFLTPPLIAFSFYFGCWHALRHTARLTSLLPKSQEASALEDLRRTFTSAVIPGLPALAGTVVVGLGLALFNHHGLTSSLLWSLLVVVWALTVPHMIATSTLDSKALLTKE
ncbi:MAG: Brp/Blh family beta-carotene 15,15'-dioxygenase [bacterium]